MVDIDKAVIARYKFQGTNFEVLVDCNKAMAFKSGSNIPIDDVLAAKEVFADSKKGMEASPTALKQAFGTDDPVEAAKVIIRKGEIQLTAEYRNQLRDQKRKQVINIIHRNGVNPKTHTPHPAARIEAAMEEAKVSLDEYKPAEQQVQDVLKKLQPIIPIKFETKQIEVKVPGKYTGKTYPILKSFGKMIKEEWLNDGSHVAVIEIPGGLEEEFHNKLNSITHGDNETKIINTR
ncbi:ribosome assembly factor SBDS [Candidatus Woesearchaeota archaeon]|nr:ribosome assembly factor SBDS [Candidatus Woesearchaeota archaeon]